MLGWSGLVFAHSLLLAADPTATAPAIAFTAEERAWMAAHPVIRVGHDVTYQPYAIQEKDGKIVGIDPDYFELIAQRTGLKFDHQVRRNWPTMMEAFKAHEVDLLPSLGKSAGREAFLIYTQPYAYAPSVIITRSDSTYLFSLQDLSGKTVSIPAGYAGLRRELDANAPGNVVKEYETSLDCYRAVERREVFASIGDVANAAWLIKGHQLTGLRLGSVVLNDSDIFLGVRKDWPILAGILNKTLASVTAEERQRINQRWIMVDYAADRWWITAFKIAVGIAGAAVLVFMLAFLHNRRLAFELAARRRIQAELEQARDKLVRASQEKNELMHMLAHDLRSPLTGINLGVDLLQLEPPLTRDDLKSTAGRIREASGRMARLIDDLLSAQNVEEGQFNLNFSAGDAGQLVGAAVAAVRAVAQDKRITVAVLVPAHEVRLITDFIALQQVVDNLLSNAIKYSPLGTRVEIALTAGATHCRFEVRDQGPGVLPAERERIFEKFGRGSARPTQGEPSTGLGLWIVLRYVTALQGRVWCEPGVGAAGSVFVVEVPLAVRAA